MEGEREGEREKGENLKGERERERQMEKAEGFRKELSKPVFVA